MITLSTLYYDFLNDVIQDNSLIEIHKLRNNDIASFAADTIIEITDILQLLFAPEALSRICRFIQ